MEAIICSSYSAMVNGAQQASKRVPWNKGDVTGAKPPPRPKHVWSIRTKLQIEGRARELAMPNLAIDSELRASASASVRGSTTYASPSTRRKDSGGFCRALTQSGASVSGSRISLNAFSSPSRFGIYSRFGRIIGRRFTDRSPVSASRQQQRTAGCLCGTRPAVLRLPKRSRPITCDAASRIRRTFTGAAR